jgi:hypothetical protein
MLLCEIIAGADSMKMLLFILTLGTLFFSSLTQAQATDTEKSCFPLVTWASKNSTEPVTIQNGNGVRLIIQIIVSKTSSTSVGINVKNCGTTSHVDAGSSTVCFNTDGSNPVTFSSDSGTVAAAGTYQIKQQ